MNYLWIHLIVIAGPLMFTFMNPVNFYQRWPAVFISLLLVGPFYIGWDILATKRGDWQFNQKYVQGKKIAGLPIEEVLFFITVPYSCLFIYESVRTFFPSRIIFYHEALYFLLIAMLIFLALRFQHLLYTRTVLIVTAFFFAAALLLEDSLLASSHFWLSITLTYIPFMIFNGMLTKLPVVIYNPRASWDIRITTIPLEDFIYSFSMLGFYFLIYAILSTYF